MAAAEVLTISHGIDDKVKEVGEKVASVDHKIDSVIQGELHLYFQLRNLSSAFTLIDVKETGVAIQQVVNQVTHLNRPSSSDFIADHESLTSLTGNELRKDLRKWVSPPDPSVNYNAASDAHHEGTAAWCTKGETLADWKSSGSLLWIHGKRTYPIIVQVLICH